MRVLYVNQTAQVSGAERSLLALLDNLPDEVEPVAAVPVGELADMLVERGIECRPIVGTQASFRLHPLHTSRGLLEIGRSAFEVRRLAAAVGADIIHANTTRAALLALLARRPHPPVVSHIRDWAPEGRFPRLVLGLIARRSDVVVANSAYIARQFEGLRPRQPVRVLHNPVDLTQFDPGKFDSASARRLLELPAGAVTLAVVAQLTPWKGQDDAIRALAALPAGGSDVVLMLAGSAKFSAAGTQFDNVRFGRDLHGLAAELGVADRVRFLGERDDVPRVLAATDILLVPSWREAFGRIAVEGMAMGVPVIATNVGGPAEIVRPWEDGLLLAPREPGRWAEALEPLVEDAALRRRMGGAGRFRAKAFEASVHVEQALEIYRDALSAPSAAAR